VTCPDCGTPLTPGQYFWTHTHPTPVRRLVGFAMMAFGAVFILVSLLELAR
jgi:hypothetical protein